MLLDKWVCSGGCSGGCSVEGERADDEGNERIVFI